MLVEKNAKQTLHLPCRNFFLFNKQFVFWATNSAKHAIDELMVKISNGSFGI